MKRIALLICICLSALQLCFSQVSEIGLCVGGSFYLGELNPSGMFAKLQPAGGAMYRYNFSPRWAFKSTVLFGSMEASDAETNGGDPRVLSFRSPLSEIAAEMELNFLKLYNEPGKNFFSPYLFAGVSLYSFNPQAKYKDKWYDLQPLGTEGQGLDGYNRERYALTGIAIPFGLGFRFNFLYYYSIGFEWGMRKTFTDYLDDVSTTYVNHLRLNTERSPLVEYFSDPAATNEGREYHEEGTARGNDQTTDWYSFANLTFSFKFNYNHGCNYLSKSPKLKVGKKK